MALCGLHPDRVPGHGTWGHGVEGSMGVGHAVDVACRESWVQATQWTRAARHGGQQVHRVHRRGSGRASRAQWVPRSVKEDAQQPGLGGEEWGAQHGLQLKATGRSNKIRPATGQGTQNGDAWRGRHLLGPCNTVVPVTVPRPTGSRRRLLRRLWGHGTKLAHHHRCGTAT